MSSATTTRTLGLRAERFLPKARLPSPRAEPHTIVCLRNDRLEISAFVIRVPLSLVVFYCKEISFLGCRSGLDQSPDAI